MAVDTSLSPQLLEREKEKKEKKEKKEMQEGNNGVRC